MREVARSVRRTAPRAIQFVQRGKDGGVSTYVWMRVLESVPERYDLGIRLLSLGRIDLVYRPGRGTGAGAPSVLPHP